jgi:hypothetical protein
MYSAGTYRGRKSIENTTIFYITEIRRVPKPFIRYEPIAKAQERLEGHSKEIGTSRRICLTDEFLASVRREGTKHVEAALYTIANAFRRHKS